MISEEKRNIKILVYILLEVEKGKNGQFHAKD